LRGLERLPIYRYVGLKDLRERVESLSIELENGGSNQYLVFEQVTKAKLTSIDENRRSIGNIRLSFEFDTGLLVVKIMPGVKHQVLHLSLGAKITKALDCMGFTEEDWVPVGTATYRGRTVSKEGDSCYCPLGTRPNADDWPTLVIEAGVSESLTKLRADAKWWLTNSTGDVKIVIIVSVVARDTRAKQIRTLKIEKWRLVTAPTRRASRRHQNPTTPTPAKVQEIVIDRNQHTPPNPPTYAITGAPLILEFQSLALQMPGQGQHDIAFTAADLERWANIYWRKVS